MIARIVVVLGGLLMAWHSPAHADIAVLHAAPGKNAFLRVGDRMVSPSGNVTLVMQGDGNLVLYKSTCIGTPACAVWNSGTDKGQGDYFFAMQEDGNAVVYQGTVGVSQVPLWNSKTPGQFANYFLVVQDDENMVIYRGSGPKDNKGAVWSTKTGPIGSTSAPQKARITLGWMHLPDCTKWEWRRILDATLVKGEQRLYGYAYVDHDLLNVAKLDTEKCFVTAVGACGLASLTASPGACLPAFKAALSVCLQEKGVAQNILNTVQLTSESRCLWK